jgi:hypothetical protein
LLLFCSLSHYGVRSTPGAKNAVSRDLNWSDNILPL